VRRKFEKPLKGSRLTVCQHVWPRASIARFARSDGVVCLYDKIRQRSRPAKPEDEIFCARRVWDQRAETGYMKGIEDAFQDLASEVVTGTVSRIDTAQKNRVDAFFALWRMRADYRESPDDEVVLKGVTGGNWSKEEEERFEMAGVSFTRKGGKMPARMLHGVRIQFGIDSYVSQLAHVEWGVIQAQAGSFVVPDYPHYMIIPLSPTICLSAGGQTGIITTQNLAEVNRSFREASVGYYFAQDLGQCP
jgi:hypothetical protein